jgi:hypothetical protein
MKGLYVTPRKASADQHAGCFFWSIFRSFLEIHDDLSVTMHDEVLDEPGFDKSATKTTQRFQGKVTARPGSDKWEMELQGDPNMSFQMAVLRLKSGELICDIHTTSWGLARTELFEPT